MRKFLKIATVFSVFGLLSLSAIAQAQEVTLRVEPGVAVPLTKPQDQRFDPGVAVAVKPELTLGSYVGVGPSLSYMALPSKIAGIDAGTALGVGGFVRVKRPHDEANTGTGWSAISPWVDADLKYVRTDNLDRLGASVGVGASVPTSDSRWLWVGPFARYDLVNQSGGQPGFNTNSAKTAIFGVSFEFGAPQKKKEAPLPPSPPPVKEPSPPPVEEKKVTTHQEDENVDLYQVIQFAWDSAELDATSVNQLDGVLAQLLPAKQFKAIRIEGHASSEGQVKHNDVLSQKRADSVLEYLVSHGIARDSLSAVGFGSRVPVATNTTEDGRVKNRRAEFAVHFIVTKEVKDQ